MVPFKERFSCTVAEASAATGLPRMKIYDAIREGRLQCVEIDERMLVLISSLEKLVQIGTADG